MKENMPMHFSQNDTLSIKGIAILFMLFHHIFYGPERWPALPIDFFPFSQGQVVYVAKFLKICVGMFVFLSGYGMYASANSTSKTKSTELAEYTFNRYVSLMLGYWFIFFIIQLVTLPTWRFLAIYGDGFTAFIYFSVDALGLAHLFKAPIYCSTWWYMSLAVLLIVIFPVAFTAIKKYRFTALLVAVLAPTAFKLPMSDLSRWLFAYLLGMYCAEYDILARTKDVFLRFSITRKAVLFLVSIVGMILIVHIRQDHTIGKKFIHIWDGLAPLYVIVMSHIFLPRHGLVAIILQFLGKHSMNMFLVHTFFIGIYFKQFMYSFIFMWIDYLVLILVSVACSILLESIKKIFLFKRFSATLRDSLKRRLSFS